MATFDDVVRLSADLPESSVASSYGTPALKVRGKTFCRLWGERDHTKSDVDAEVLVVMCDLDEKRFLLDESDGSVFDAPHYHGYGAVLVNLDLVHEELLSALLLDAYLLKAPATLRRNFPSP